MYFPTKLIILLTLFLILLKYQVGAQKTSRIKNLHNKAFIRHTVQISQTFKSIAQQYHTSSEAVSSFNNIEDYDGPVIALYLSIPLNKQNFSKTILKGQLQNAVPVYRINGKSERLVLINKNSQGTTTPSYKWSNSALGVQNLRNIHLEGYLIVADEAASLFKTANSSTALQLQQKESANLKTSQLNIKVPPVSTPQVKQEPVIASAQITTNQPLLLPNTSAIKAGDTTTVQPTESNVISKEKTKPAVKSSHYVVGKNKLVERNESVRRILNYIIILFATNVIVLFTIHIYLVIKKRAAHFKKSFAGNISRVVIDAALNSDENEPGIFAAKPQSLLIDLNDNTTKQLVLNEIIKAKNNFKGTAALNLIHLYCQLNLDVFSAKKLQQKSWSIIISGIKELAAMEQVQRLPEITKLSNHSNDYVRIEAQCALIQLSGYNGLRFLDDIKNPLTEWHQIKLINQLSNIKSEESIEFFRWLYSANNTIVMLILKTIASAKFLTMYQWVTILLKHQNEAVRLQAIECLKEIANSDTPLLLQQSFNQQTKNCQVLIIKVLGQIGCDDQLMFFLQQLDNADDNIKLAAANALVNCFDNGFFILRDYCLDKGAPYTHIISHVTETLQV